MNCIAYSSKTVPPHLPRVLERQRLVDLLLKNRHKRLILVLAQAAQGKSTLAVGFTRQSETPTAWVNLDAEDSDPINLFHVLAQSLQNAINQFDAQTILSYPALSPTPEDRPSFFREMAQALTENVTTPVCVVFDGLDRLFPHALSYRFLQALLDHSPQHVHFLMLSREMPPLELNGHRMRQQVCLVSNEDLAFTQDEIKRFFRKIHKMRLSADEVRRIHQATEGWVGGLILLVESLHRHEEEPGGRAVLLELPDHFSKEVFRYFGEEIFSSQLPQHRDFLIRSSILDLIEPGFARELTGISDAHRILEALAQKNLFVQAIYTNKKGWLFRYHQLFQKFLQAKLQLENNEKAQKSLYFKAACLLEKKGELEDAVKYFLKAEAYAEATLLLEKIGADLLKAGRVGDLSHWLAQIPEDLVLQNAWLLVYRAVTRPFTLAKDNLKSLQGALALFEAREDVRGCLLCLAYLIQASMARGNDSIPLISLLAKGESLLASLESDLYPHERGALWLKMGFAYNLRGGNPRKGLWASQNAQLIARSLGDLSLEAHSLSQILESLTLLGEYSEARQISERLAKIAAKCPHPEFRALHPMRSSLLLACAGELEEAEVVVLGARAEMEKNSLVYLYPISLLYELFVKLRLGEFDEAKQIGNHLLNLSISMDNLVLKGLALFFMGQGYYLKGDFIKAEKLVTASGTILSAEETGSQFHLHSGNVLKCLISTHLQASENNERALLQAMDYYRSISCPILLAETHLAMGLLHWKRGEMDRVFSELAEGFGIAQSKGHEHFLLMSRVDQVKACTLVLELKGEPVVDFAARLLSSRLADLAGPHLERLAAHADPQVADRALKVQESIHRSTVPLLRIETLGGFRLLRGDVPVKDEEWPAQQPRLLLKAIVSHGSSGVPKDVLLEALWPETPPESSERRFKVVLHGLRKVLEPQLRREFGSSYVHLRGNALSLDPELCRVDVDDFLSLVERGQYGERQGDSKSALSSYEEAAGLYGGDFLSEELYQQWAALRRDELRNEYIQLLYRIARLNENHRRGGRKAIEIYERIIRTDRFQEPAYQSLMTIYSNRGMRNKVLKLYEEYRKALREELGTVPDELTTAIYRKALGTQ